MKKLVLFSGKEQNLDLSPKITSTVKEDCCKAYRPFQSSSSITFQLLKLWLLLVAFFALGMSQSFAQFYDLSITQSVDKDSVGIGDTVTYTLMVNHDAGDVATGIVVTDSIGDCISVINVGTPTNGGSASHNIANNTITWNLADLDATDGSSVLTFQAIVLEEGICFNVAEITSSLNDLDSEADNQNYLEDDIAAVCTSVPIQMCTALQDTVLVSAPTGATNVQWYRVYDFGADGAIGVGDTMLIATGNSTSIDSAGTYFFTADLGSCQAGNCCPLMIESACMDLALTKTLSTTGTVTPGDTVQFAIKVFNQGDIPADSIQLYDYLPDDLNLVVENGWALTGTGDTTATRLLTIADGDLSTGGLAPDDSVTVNIRTVIAADFLGTSLVNFAEIGNQTDINGNDIEDADSSDDSDEVNDPGGEPGGPTDNVTDNSNGDEDDHDPAEVIINQVFDLALRKVLASGQPSMVNVGDTVTFQVWVFNQGTQAAYNTNIIDYTPSDMTLVTGGRHSVNWIDNTTTASLFHAGPIAAGDSISFDISYKVDDNFMGTSITNTAEISSSDNDTNSGNTPPVDVDSSPDALDGETNVTNNDITGDANNGEDEDDHDIEPIIVNQVYDLALTKVLAESGPFASGDTVTFRIYVHNQGTLDAAANTVTVQDYVPADMTLVDVDWTVGGTYTFSNAIAAGGVDSVDVDLQIDPSFMGTIITNNAEIVADGGDDVDSAPADNAGDNPDANDNSTADGNSDPTTQDPNDDDFDPASVLVSQVYDLALTKILAESGPFAAGDTVTFRILSLIHI